MSEEDVKAGGGSRSAPTLYNSKVSRKQQEDERESPLLHRAGTSK